MKNSYFIILFLFFYNVLFAQNRYVDKAGLIPIIIEELNVRSNSKSSNTELYSSYTYQSKDGPEEVSGYYKYYEFYWETKRDLKKLNLDKAKLKIIKKFEKLGYKNIYKSEDETILTFQNTMYSIEPIYIELYIPNSLESYIEFILVSEYSENKLVENTSLFKQKSRSFYSSFPDFKKCNETCIIYNDVKTYYKHFYISTVTDSIGDYTRTVDLYNTPSHTLWVEDLEHKTNHPNENPRYVWEARHYRFHLDVVIDTIQEKRFKIVPVKFQVFDNEKSSMIEMETICKESQTPEMVIYLKIALEEAGFYYGEINDENDKEFIDAIHTFQKYHNLPLWHLNLKTLEKL